MHRFYADSRGIQDGMAHLPPEDAVHALRVLRLKPGDDVQLYSGGEAYSARITDTATWPALRLSRYPPYIPFVVCMISAGCPSAARRCHIPFCWTTKTNCTNLSIHEFCLFTLWIALCRPPSISRKTSRLSALKPLPNRLSPLLKRPPQWAPSASRRLAVCSTLRCHGTASC